MIELINTFAAGWLQYLTIMTIQSTLFAILVFGLLYIYRRKNIFLLKVLTVIGLLKFVLPPFIQSPFYAENYIPVLTDISIPFIVNSQQAALADVFLSIESIILLLWMLTALVIIGRVIYQYIIKTLEINKLNTIEVTESFNDLSLNRISFYKSDELSSPYVIGFFRKRVVLPSSWEDWSKNQKSMVATHELMHISQQDHWIGLLKLCVFAINFFNPLVWLLIKKLNHYSELVCDNLTIEKTGISNIRYTKELIDVSAESSDPKVITPVSLAFSESYSRIKKRISYHLSNGGTEIMKTDKTYLRIFVAFSILIMVPFLMKCESDQTLKSDPDITAKTEEVESNTSPKIYAFEDLTEKPKMIHGESPAYPDEARKNGIQGTVLLTITLDENGNVGEVEVLESIDPLLDNAAKEAAKKCTFSPAMIDGKQVKAKLNLPYKFALK